MEVPLVRWVLLVLLESRELKDRKVLKVHRVLQVRREIQESSDRPDHLALPLT